MKKRLLLLLGLIVIISLLALASAQSPAQRVMDAAEDVFSVLVGGGDYVLEKVVFFLIIMSLVYVSLKRIPNLSDNNSILWIVTISVALLSARFLTEVTFIRTILLSYTVLGVSLTAGIPLVIYFFFVQSFESSTLRKIMWTLFIIVFIGIWFARYDEVGELSWIYFFTGVAALIFLLADGTIRRMLIKQKMKQLDIANRGDYEREILRNIDQARRDHNRNIISDWQFRKIMSRLRRQLNSLKKL